MYSLLHIRINIKHLQVLCKIVYCIKVCDRYYNGVAVYVRT